MYFYGYRQHQPHAFVNKLNKLKLYIFYFYMIICIICILMMAIDIPSLMSKYAFCYCPCSQDIT